MSNNYIKSSFFLDGLDSYLRQHFVDAGHVDSATFFLGRISERINAGASGMAQGKQLLYSYTDPEIAEFYTSAAGLLIPNVLLSFYFVFESDLSQLSTEGVRDIFDASDYFMRELFVGSATHQQAFRKTYANVIQPLNRTPNNFISEYNGHVFTVLMRFSLATKS